MGRSISISPDSLDTLDHPEFGEKPGVAEVLARVPEAMRVAEPVPLPFRSVGSTAIGPADRVALRALIQDAAGVAVVQCSRAAGGRVGHRRFLRENGIIPGEDFSPQRARIPLMLAPGRTADPGAIAWSFASH